MDKKVRYGLIGLGKIGTQHTKKLVAGAVPNLEYVAVADTDPKALAKAKELIGDQVLTFSSAEELIHSGTVDAIHICVPREAGWCLCPAGGADGRGGKETSGTGICHGLQPAHQSGLPEGP